PAAMQLDDAAADGEPQAAALLVAGRAEAHEALEHALALLGFESGPLVFQAAAPHAVPDPGLERDGAARRRSLERVGQQIEQHLAQPLRFERDRSVGFVRPFEPAAVMLREDAGVERKALQKLAGVLLLGLDLDRMGAGAGEKKQLVDDLVEPGKLLDLH